MIYDNIDTVESEAQSSITTLAEMAAEHSKDAAKWRKIAYSMRKALESISEPLAHMQKKAEKEGMKLDGNAALFMIKDPGYLKSLAKDELCKWGLDNQDDKKTNKD